MDISTELSAVATRIEQITGAPTQLPGLPQQAQDGAGSFASMLQSQMAAQGSDSSGEGAPGAPAARPARRGDECLGARQEEVAGRPVRRHAARRSRPPGDIAARGRP